MSDQQNFKVVKIGLAFTFTMLFCCILSVLIISVKDLKCGEILIDALKNLCKFSKGLATMKFLIKMALIIAGILAAYKHLFSVIILVATLVLFYLIDDSIYLNYNERKLNGKLWDAICAETVALGLCFLFACTLAFFIQRHRP
jgi:predicted membrane metal-binding protein